MYKKIQKIKVSIDNCSNIVIVSNKYVTSVYCYSVYGDPMDV